MPLAQARRKRSRNPGKIDEFIQSTLIDSFTKSLLHLNGVDGSGIITDVMGKSWTVSGSAALSTAQKKFGTASVFISQVGGFANYISTPSHADFHVGAGDFSFEFFLRLSSFSAGGTVPLLVRRGGAGNDSYIFQYISAVPELRLNWTVDGTNFIGPAGFATTLSLNTWYHIALERAATNLRCYVNGTQVGSTFNIATANIFAGTAPLQLGSSNSGVFTYDLYIDEFRFSKGIARWGANFTPPDEEYY